MEEEYGGATKMEGESSVIRAIGEDVQQRDVDEYDDGNEECIIDSRRSNDTDDDDDDDDDDGEKQ